MGEGLAHRWLSVALAVAASFAGAEFAFAGESPGRPLRRTAEEMGGMVASVGKADREADAARAALNRAIRSAKVYYQHADRLRQDPHRPRNAARDEVIQQMALGAKALLEGIEETRGHVQHALEALEGAQEQARGLEESLAKKQSDSAQEVRELRAEIEELRKSVARRWEHYNSPRLAHNREAKGEARVQVSSEMSKAAAEWQALRVEQAKLSFIADRRQRLRRAETLLERRRALLEQRMETLEAFREFLLNPLDNPPPERPLDRIEWPSSLAGEVSVLAEEFEPPRPYRLPDQWGVEERVKRFIGGGTP